MIPTSTEFLLFFTVVAALYFALPCRLRWMLLLAASYLFYALFKLEYVLLLACATGVTYVVAIQMYGAQNSARKKAYLAFGILTVLGALVFFKYAAFFGHTFRALGTVFTLDWRVPELKILIPVGISFFSFRIVSYLVDVYRGTEKPQRHLGLLALHVAFFPELIAGPIDRTANLVPQLRTAPGFNHERVVSGLQLMVWGFFKKLVIADSLSILVNQIYNNPTLYSGYPLIIATYAFAFQIYCDFSGYTDIATGMSRVMGYNIMPNFKQPYFSGSVVEFWRRWHISLSSWFRDYLYIPLGGNRVHRLRRYVNLLIVFIVSGLWHGASWTFALWGLLHGIYTVMTDAIRNLSRFTNVLPLFVRNPVIMRLANIFTTFHLVLFAWIFFRANSIVDAGYIVSHLFASATMLKSDLPLGLPLFQILLAFGCIVLMISVEFIQRTSSVRVLIKRMPTAVRWTLYVTLVLVIINLQPQIKAAFVYMQL